MTDLFTRYNLNGVQLPNRIVIAPMTQTRATEDAVPTDLMAEDPACAKTQASVST